MKKSDYIIILLLVLSIIGAIYQGGPLNIYFMTAIALVVYSIFQIGKNYFKKPPKTSFPLHECWK